MTLLLVYFFVVRNFRNGSKCVNRREARALQHCNNYISVAAAHPVINIKHLIKADNSQVFLITFVITTHLSYGVISGGSRNLYFYNAGGLFLCLHKSIST